jgi:hypothetical protein
LEGLGMGEAKIRREALIREMLDSGEKWDFPLSEWEASVCAELRKMDVVVVPRVPADQLAWARMQPNKCHENTRWYEKNDPEHKSRMVSGWWVQGPNYILHSVIERDGKLICITPIHFGDDEEIQFIPDKKITWTEDGKFYHAARDGVVIGLGVRAFPAFTMAQNRIVRDRILAGVAPYDAVRFTDGELEELKRQYIPRTA